MSIWRLVVREVGYRKLSFSLAVLSVIVAVGCMVSQVLLLEQHDVRTEQILADKEKETQAAMAQLEDDIRKITKNMGFNLRILPKDLNLFDYYSKDYSDKFMPEKYIQVLVNSQLLSINHLLPLLQQKVEWKEQGLTINLVGTRGEVHILAQKNKKKPILETVPSGKMVLGYEIHQTLSKIHGKNLAPGDALVLGGEKFLIHKVNSPRGDRDDVTVWIDLKQAQDLLNKPGLISGMYALDCLCTADRLGVIREEIARILPDTRVEEWETKATARAEARTKAAAESRAAIEREKKHRADMRAQKENFAALLVPFVVLASCVWLAVMAWNNVRERRTEIGLLRALGLRSGPLFLLFLSRALFAGFLGAVLGYLGGAGASLIWEENQDWTTAFSQPMLPLLVVLITPGICALACWLPTLLAVRQDPAVILQQE